MKIFRLYACVVVILIGSSRISAQTTCTISASGNWSTRTCVEGGVSPGTSGVNVVIPNGVAVTINTNPNKTGNLLVETGGSVLWDQANALWNGSIIVQSGATMSIEKKVDMGNSGGGCNNKLTVESGGTLTLTGSGASDLLSICGQPVAQSGGGCSVFPNGSLPWCQPAGGWPSGGFTFDQTGLSGINYTWDGSSSSVWGTAANWTPDRNALTTEDQLIFPAGAANQSITSIPAQTIGSISVTGGTYTFSPGSPGITLSFSTTTGNASGNNFQIDNGATLNMGAASSLNISVIANGRARIGGQLRVVNGTFSMLGGSTLTLHTNSAPLARTSGQVSLNSTSILQFGDASNTGGSTIVLPNNIFSAAQTISSLLVNRTNGATLGNQSLTVNSGATFTLGDLNTTASSPLIFSTTASSPTESSASKVVGYAQMASRSVGTGALDFLGFNISAGTNDVGFMTVVRRTGTAGLNTFNGNQSILASWDVTANSDPAAGRNVVLRWVPTFDGVNTATNPFRTYFFNGGPSWTQIGTESTLTATTPLRTSAAKSTIDLNDIFTLADNTQSLPVSFQSVICESTVDAVNVFWSTASETQNEKFVIERKGTEGFYAIGELSGAGTSLVLKKYAFTDINPAKGWNYYRIKQVDYDGNFEYSKVVGANYDGSGIGITIFPNPSNDGVINFGGVEKEVSVIVQDLRGRVIFTGTITGENSQIDTKNFASASGLYYVVTQEGTARKFHRVVLK